MSKQVNQELLEKFLMGKCSPEEQELVNIFLKKPESEELLNKILSENEAKDFAAFSNDQTVHPKHGDWKNSIQERMGYKPTLYRRKLTGSFQLRQAAIWIVMILAGVGIYAISYLGNAKKDKLVFVERNNPNGQRSKIILSDSSVVYLGAGSRLKYPETFAGETREIYLYGEAFFEVKKNPQRPFMIHTGQIQTKVLGTSFKIEAFKNQPLVVGVATGKVRVDHINGEFSKSLAVLIPGQKMVLDHGKVTNLMVNLEEVKDLKEARLTFNDASLIEISKVLQRWYNVRVTFKKQAKSRERMTLTLDASVSIDKVLNVLAAAGHFNYTIKNKEIIIR